MIFTYEKNEEPKEGREITMRHEVSRQLATENSPFKPAEINILV